MGMKFKEFAWEGCGSGSEQVNVPDNSINKHTANITGTRDPFLVQHGLDKHKTLRQRYVCRILSFFFAT